MHRSRVHALLAELTREHAVPGVQLAIHHEDRTWVWEAGVVRHGEPEPMTTAAAVPTGSITKVVTAATVMALAVDGDLELDEPLAAQVGGLDTLPADLGDALTLRHLLSHTSGLPSDSAGATAPSLRRLLAEEGADLAPLAEPGVAFSYSNLGYLLIGHAIEDVTGMSWAEAAAAIVLTPLGITPRLVVGPRRTGGIVSGHTVDRARGVVRPVAQSLGAVEAPAGAIAASAADLVLIGRALTGHEPGALLDPGSIKDMQTPVPGAEPFGMADGWGLGLASYGSAPSTSIGHDGTGDGTSCHLRMNPSTGTVVAMTANAGSGFALWRALAAELPAYGVPVKDHDPMPETGDPTPVPPGCEGDYDNGGTVYSIVHRGPESLRLTVDEEPFADLTFGADLRFTMRDCDTGETDQVGRILTDGSGSPAWLQVGGRLARKRALVPA
ncbi:CubicO group peptidase, beta-lactamase class C family [Actinokineospora alba]|uniref:CubicO group peptidase, beta-lactamase class C family n=1 Tax=Actinokineospora alba TaxID=504798 RepID=A0A1H0FUP8_9PSEU|nr:serine hydrolase domain-containing protein [Actinokineospora alba]TDP69620.1 CubicO group peptidase (beta-lactamase class C family) [Actinokineospora alba]SDI12796.1 CubicO group peptidase, beta-lactamase class C family [Actinokineospora alba]SDN98199.1 CubicO group peptidase, beta-lactamase class C family [Actinokineospora alba]